MSERDFGSRTTKADQREPGSTLKKGSVDPFVLRRESAPSHLHPLLDKYSFRRATRDEVLDSEHLTQDAWPGIEPTNKHDLITRDIINEPMCAAFTPNGDMIGYTRLLWGYDDEGTPEIHSHMTAVSSTSRDGGLGEALKWQARQVAQEFPATPVNQHSVTFDNQQGRIAHVNLNKLGMVCGDAGGAFRRNIYGELQGAQHKGNPTDRYQALWHLDSDWVQARLDGAVTLFSLDEVKQFPTTVDWGYQEFTLEPGKPVLPVPTIVNTELDQSYLTLPSPSVWDEYLQHDASNDKVNVNQWRQAHRAALETYHSQGYTTIMQASDREAGINLQVLAKNFDPYNPPRELVSF